jgi:hypothetical protein
MIRRNHLLALGTVGLLALVGCSAPADQATTPSVVDSTQTAAGAAKDGAMGAADATKDAAGAAKDGAMGAADATKNAMTAGMGGPGELMTVVTNTKTAVEAGDFAKASTEFAKFKDSWAKVGEGIKTASPDGYAAIESGVGTVNKALGEAQPDKTKVMDALAALTTSITSVAKP